MSTATVEVAAGGLDAPGLYLSASQITKFTTCEHKWLLSKTLPPEQRRFAGSDATDLGTLMHTLMGAWWSGRDWHAEWIAAVAEYVGVGIEDVAYMLQVPSAHDPAWDEVKPHLSAILEREAGWTSPKTFLRALAIMDAWVAVHGEHPSKDPDPEWSNTDLVALELPFDLPIPGVPGARVRGFLDGLVSTPVDKIRTHDTLRLLEFKTMGKWGRENQVPFDPQLNLYLWAARQLMGPSVEGAVFEAISTYDYKQGGPERRFKRIPLEYDQRKVAMQMDNVKKVARRAKALLKNPALAIRNIGDACTYCDFRRQCLTPWEM